MGTYTNSTNDVIEALEESLNKIEGDFTERQLRSALMVIKEYPYVCDKEKSESKYKKFKEGAF